MAPLGKFFNILRQIWENRNEIEINNFLEQIKD